VFIYLIVLTTSHAGPLHDAASKGGLAGIAAALDAGADIEEQEKGATPLFLAVRSDHPQAAELLIERGANERSRRARRNRSRERHRLSENPLRQSRSAALNTSRARYDEPAQSPNRANVMEPGQQS